MLLDKLLQSDIRDLTAMPTAEIEIKRLSEKIGEPFLMKVKGLKTRKVMEIMDFATKTVEKEVYNEKTGKWQKVKEKEQDYMAATIQMIVDGAIDPPFTDARLLEKWHTPVPTDVVENMFTAKEIADISGKIAELSGIDMKMTQRQVDDEIKN